MRHRVILAGSRRCIDRVVATESDRSQRESSSSDSSTQCPPAFQERDFAVQNECDWSGVFDSGRRGRETLVRANKQVWAGLPSCYLVTATAGVVLAWPAVLSNAMSPSGPVPQQSREKPRMPRAVFVGAQAAFIVLERMGSVTAFSVANSIKRGVVIMAGAAMVTAPLGAWTIVGAVLVVLGACAYWVSLVSPPPSPPRPPLPSFHPAFPSVDLLRRW